MIESKILNLLRLRVPNYHIVSERFANDTYSVCTCGKCRNCMKGKSYGSPEKDGVQQLSCERVFKDLMEMGCYGHARVNEYGTCDAAQFIPDDNSNFKLEGEEAVSAVVGDGVAADSSEVAEVASDGK